jgi:N-acetyl-anhydromuramyl-L-alanine amidase AmpD
MFKPRIATTLAGAALLTACGFNALPRDAAPREGAGLAARVKAIPEPALRSILSPHFNERDGAPISTIVLHHTAMVETAVQTAEFFQRPAAMVSSHYIVDRSGELVRAVPDDKRSWHAGRSEFLGEQDVNTFSIGIEICNVGDGLEPYPQAQMQAIVRLVAWLAQTYNVPLATRLTRHRDVAVPAGRKIDTSNNFDHAYVAKAAQALIDGRRLPAFKAQRAPAGYDPRKQVHVVQAGETFASIADDVYDAEALGAAIARLNPGAAPRPGVVLALPTRY